jgi:hypothetical protein
MAIIVLQALAVVWNSLDVFCSESATFLGLADKNKQKFKSHT